MAQSIKLGKLSGLRLIARPSALAGTLLLWGVLSAAARWVFTLPLAVAIPAGLAATALHWVSEIFHQFGHAWAARRTGYSMTGILFWGVLTTSLYPPEEPALPASIHIRRALGGPAASFLLSLVAAALAALLLPLGGVLRLLGAFFFLENLLVFALGSFLPLGFTDGSTLLAWWARHGK